MSRINNQSGQKHLAGRASGPVARRPEREPGPSTTTRSDHRVLFHPVSLGALVSNLLADVAVSGAWSTAGMPNGERLPDEVVLTHEEAADVLFALDAAMDDAEHDASLYVRLEAAARIIVEKFLPDLPDL